jgi:hypothetical protein
VDLSMAMLNKQMVSYTPFGSFSYGKWHIETDDVPIKTSIYNGFSSSLCKIIRW